MGCTSSSQASKGSALPTLLGNCSQARQSFHKGSALDTGTVDSSPKRGCRDLIRGVNHIALVVRDIGRSVHFYVDVLGFDLIDRPNFDRHGAWLSMGNIQLHLIKGTPDVCQGKHPNDLIVSHVALDISDVNAVVKRLKELQRNKAPELRWRQNVSVPTAKQSAGARFESDHTSDDGATQQFFLEDPDGYWIELCNCAEDHSGETEKIHHSSLPRGRGFSSFSSVAKLTFFALRWIRRARQQLQIEEVERELALLVPVEPKAVSAQTLEYFCLRRNTFGDACQGFAKEELLDALAKAGGNAPGAILILQKLRQATGRAFVPPAFLDDRGQVHRSVGI
eukprot:TRINITY_DN4309_c0_g1_i4.p1 TRINITY_DN4309_c0_g1~~TRINITY_DN4309_c0_g1_i4.p1  ORF type:complete len:337 (-),score=61.62 TRINITY_DN4309_c0_g1_i4:302-1312(-)